MYYRIYEQFFRKEYVFSEKWELRDEDTEVPSHLAHRKRRGRCNSPQDIPCCFYGAEGCYATFFCGWLDKDFEKARDAIPAKYQVLDKENNR